MAIIKYRVEATVTRTDKNKEENVIASDWQYEEVYNPHKDGKIITKEVAMDKIKKLGLVEVCRNQHGVIWDSPDEPMLKKYEGTFSHLK